MALRTLALMVAILVLSTAALLLLAAAAVLALSHWIGMLPALLSLAAALVILALVLALILGRRPRRQPLHGLGALSPGMSDGKQVTPIAIIAGGLALGLIIGLRRRR
jgi:hypothetical protein